MAQNNGSPQWPELDLGQLTVLLTTLFGGIAATWGAVKGIRADRREAARQALADEDLSEAQTIRYAFELVDQLRAEVKRIREDCELEIRRIREEAQAESARLRKELADARVRIAELERVNRDRRGR